MSTAVIAAASPEVIEREARKAYLSRLLSQQVVTGRHFEVSSSGCCTLYTHLLQVSGYYLLTVDEYLEA